MKSFIPLQKNIHPQAHILHIVDSTNDFIKKIKPFNNICFCIAEEQTKGRGQFQRQWYSPKGENIYFSMRYPISKLEKNNPINNGISLVIAIVVCKTLQKIENLPYKIKWPNDILINKKKICGILVESYTNESNETLLIIGIGINVNMKIKSQNNQWTSLFQETNHQYDRNIICIALITQLENALNQFMKNGLNYFKKDWEQYDALYNTPVSISKNHTVLNGIGHSINNYGHLQLLTSQGIISCASGESKILKDKKIIK